LIRPALLEITGRKGEKVTRNEKTEVVAKLESEFKTAEAIVVCDYRGLSVKKLEVLRNSRNIEENERIYFCGWRNNNINERVSDENLYKTKIAFGDEYFNICRQNNISSRWTDIPNAERINEINNILN